MIRVRHVAAVLVAMFFVGSVVGLGVMLLCAQPAWGRVSFFDIDAKPRQDPPASPSPVTPLPVSPTPATPQPPGPPVTPPPVTPPAPEPVVAPAEPPKPVKMAPPDAATQEKNLKLARMIFEKEYAQNTPDGRRQLVATLLDEAGNIKKNLSAKFVLLEQARDLAVETGDAKSCRRAIEQLDEGFIVDAMAMAANVLAKFLPRSAADGAVLGWGADIVDHLIKEENYDAGAKLVSSFPSAAYQKKDTDIPARLLAAKAAVGEYQRIKPTLEKLAADPADPAANLAAGRFYCFTRGDWAKGLPLLAKGSDAQLRDVAAAELAKPAESSAQLALANQWWEAAKAAAALADAMRGRAGYWYEKALPGLKDLEEVLARKRLADLAAAAAARSEPMARPGMLRVPPGFKAKAGTVAEPYTKTGWAKQIVHEGTGFELVFIPAGRFLMGSPENEEKRNNYETQHEVILSKPFYIAIYEVTRGQFAAFVKDTGHKTDVEKNENGSSWRNPGYAQTDMHPVVWISWNDASSFCEWLSRKTGRAVRLPTEAEWEYACRAGTQTPFNMGQTISTDQANYNGKYTYGSGVKGLSRQATVPVGSFRPNAWGLYDMHGNVWEWCADWSGTYPSGSVTDPTGALSGTTRVLRGGSWFLEPYFSRSARRDFHRPFVFNNSYGFRVAASVAGVDSTAIKPVGVTTSPVAPAPVTPSTPPAAATVARP